MNISPQLLEFLASWEGPPSLIPRPDPSAPGVWDIGYGHVCAPDAPRLQSIGAALVMLRADIDWTAAGVRRLVKVVLAPHQTDALISFAFNVGLDEDTDTIAEGLGDSTLLKLINKRQFQQAAGEFGKWNHAGGKVVNGLTKRRAAERAMFVRGDYSGRP